MALVRLRQNKKYMVIHNKLIQDERISFCSKGLWFQLSNLSDEILFNLKDLVHPNSEDEATIEEALKELEKFGYLTRDEDIFTLNDNPKK